MMLVYDDKFGREQTVVCDRVELRDDGTIECYAFRSLPQGRGEMGLEGILQLEPQDRMGRVIVL